MWWRVFIPAWRFFDHPGTAPRLLARTAHGEWRELLEPPRAGLAHLLLNPEGNLNHARTNLLHRLLEEVRTGGQPVDELVSFRLTAHTAREILLTRGWAQPGECFDFKITSHGEDALISREHVL